MFSSKLIQFIFAFISIKSYFTVPVGHSDLLFRSLTSVELSAFLTCVPGSKFTTITSFLSFNAETTCDDVSLINSDTSANGTVGFEVIQIPFSALSPYSNRQVTNDQEVNGTISYGRCAGDSMLSEHIGLGDAGSCSTERKVARLSTLFSVIRIKGKCQSFCSGVTTIRLSPNVR